MSLSLHPFTRTLFKRSVVLQSALQRKLMPLLLAVLCLLLGACSNDISDLQSHVDTMVNRQDYNVPPPPKYEEFPKFAYVAANFRDPFIAPTKVSMINNDTIKSGLCKGPKPDATRRREMLEGMPLDTLRMVGTLEQQGTLWALLLSKDGTVHRVKPDYYIGQNHGRVVSISDSKVTINEIIENIDNQAPDGCPYRFRPASIALSE